MLILDGWFDWPDGSTFLATAQEHKDLIFPYLQVKDRGRKLEDRGRRHGMPSGRQKRMAVDLAGKFLTSSREVRIVTNLCVYWDEIFPDRERRTSAGKTHHASDPVRRLCTFADSLAR